VVSGRGLRVFASTSGDLLRSAREGTFHPGLADRLSRFQIPLPPLRERPEDIGALALHLSRRIGATLGRPQVRFDRSAIALLRRATWVGNVQELASVVEKLVAFSPEGAVTRKRVTEILGDLPDSVGAMRQQRSQLQRAELATLLETCGGNLAEVARRLQISRGAVIYRAQKHGLLQRSAWAKRPGRGREESAAITSS
jgi:DNA-binding NtrC family response regulator